MNVGNARRSVVLLLLAVAGLIAAGAAPSQRTHVVTVELTTAARGAVQVLNVTLYDKTTPDKVRAMLKAQLEACVTVTEPTADILATAWDGNENQILPPGEMLVFVAKSKKIMTWDEYEGVRRDGENKVDYSVETEEGKTLAGIKPERKWLTVTLVYANAPAPDAAYAAIISEVEKAAAKGLDVCAYVSVGDKADRATWKQLKGPDGAYVIGNYDAKSKRLETRGKLLKQFE